MTVRETKGWSYGVYSQLSGDKERLAWVAVAPVQADRTGDSIKEFRSELTAFLNDKGTTPAELERTINSNVRAMPGSFEPSDDVTGGLRSIVKFGRAAAYYAKLPETYAAMNAAEHDSAAPKQQRLEGPANDVIGDAPKQK